MERHWTYNITSFRRRSNVNMFTGFYHSHHPDLSYATEPKQMNSIFVISDPENSWKHLVIYDLSIIYPVTLTANPSQNYPMHKLESTPTKINIQIDPLKLVWL